MVFIFRQLLRGFVNYYLIGVLTKLIILQICIFLMFQALEHIMDINCYSIAKTEINI